jgi:DNA modification methylase
MDAHYSDDLVTLYHGDCRDILATLDDASVDACVTDPPYELGFMGKRWDASGIAYDVAMWGEVLRVLKPGGHLSAFGGTRTYHRMTAAIEDAGFEIRDSIHWIYGSGFPKSLDVSKAIDKAAGAEREVIGIRRDAAKLNNSGNHQYQEGWQRPHREDPDYRERKSAVTAPATEMAAAWSGWGTALKPAHEPIVVARKPLNGTVADTVQAHGTGALNIDACRVGAGGHLAWSAPRDMGYHGGTDVADSVATESEHGRWPANLILTHHPDCTTTDCTPDCPCTLLDVDEPDGPSRFFAQSRWATDESSVRYVAKPSRTERDNGQADRNTHPTVKPLELVRWLIRLVTPPGGTVLEPFAGSGTTLEAAIAENCQAIGIELTADYLPIIVGRITKPIQPTLGDV